MSNNEAKIEDFEKYFNENCSYEFAVFKKIQNILNTPYQMPEFDPIRGEICECLIYGLDVAAITATNFLVEHFLKTVLTYKYSHNQKKNCNDSSDIPIGQYFLEGQKKYNSFTLNKSIDESFKEGIINKEEKDQLHNQRELLRNAYSHADKDKIFGNTEVSGNILDFSGNNLEISESKQFPITNLPFTQGIMIKRHAKANALPYFKFVDKLIRKSIPILFPNTIHDETESNPDK